MLGNDVSRWYDCDVPPMGRARWLRRDVVHMVGKPDEQSQQWRKKTTPNPSVSGIKD